MGNTADELISVDKLCELWAQKQRNFEKDIHDLLDKSKLMAKKMSASAEAAEAVEQSEEDALLAKTRTQQELKLNELMIHLTEELQRRHNDANAKKRMKEWHKSLDKMRLKLLSTSQTLQKIGLVDKLAIEKLCHTEEYTQRKYEMLGQELQSCETLRHQNLPMLINHVCEDINHWSDLTLQYPTIRSYQSECYTEELLELLEQKLIDLQGYYNRYKNIFELYSKRTKMWRRMLALEEQAKEPNRYHNRGGQLLREERERKYIAQKLPLVEQELGQLVQQYEHETSQPFLVYGEEMLSRLAADWEEYRSAKELLNKNRKPPKMDKSQTVSVSTFNSLLLIRDASSVPDITSNPTPSKIWSKRAKKLSK